MAGADEFDANMARLSEAVGHGKLTGRVEVDQVYAQYQHEGLNLKHPHGGKAKYLSDPLMEDLPEFMKDLADGAITEDGSDLNSAMAESMEALARKGAEQAPKEWGDLANSMHPTVRDGERVVYDRPPKARRLTDEELRLKARWRR